MKISHAITPISISGNKTKDNSEKCDTVEKAVLC